ncbi:predicted protein [Nematostella vectensis]|uniref:J domain-containing protein n=1 Tax=Nematostella vectensis TaxID=45351 RepID=A7SCX2_NEMVE|nr:predicted protein [Nematostella vectensis]|eukprot:XP_001630541.1 predicted protein [Nematostella vectensis]
MVESKREILVVNDSDAEVTLYLYPTWDHICWLSTESRIIKPKQKTLYSKKKEFKFKLKARWKGRGDNKKTCVKELQELSHLKESKLFRVRGTDGSAVAFEETLTDTSTEKQVCLRKNNMGEDLKRTCGMPNLYEILGLDMKTARKLSKDELKKTLKKACRKQLLIWHPDKNGGDAEQARNIIVAYSCLEDDETRARYNNQADYDEGWTSLKRWKAIFKPECATEEQKRQFRKRLCYLALSAGAFFVGLGLIVGTAGAGAVPLVAGGGVFGGGFFGGGVLSLQHATSLQAVAEGVELGPWMAKFGLGFTAGAITGGTAVGTTALISGLGGAALESTAVGVGQYIGAGAATGAVGGGTMSLASDLGRKHVDGEEIPGKNVAFRALTATGIGAAAGALGGLVTKAMVSSTASAASSNLEGELAEQVMILAGARKFANVLARNVPKTLTESGTQAILGSAANFADERLNENVENRTPQEHLEQGAKALTSTLGQVVVQEVASSAVSHAINEIKVHRRVKKEFPSTSSKNHSNAERQRQRRRVRFAMSQEENEHRNNVSRSTCSRGGYKRLENETENYGNPGQTTPLIDIDDIDIAEGIDEAKFDGKIKYINNGSFESKMVVSFRVGNQMRVEVAKGSGSWITVPENATNIRVRFMANRLVWCDVKKYNRFSKTWVTPTEEHIFRYSTPPALRVFILSGNIYTEKVIRVANEYHEETKEME